MDWLPWTIVPLAGVAYLVMLRLPAVARTVFLVLGTLCFAGLLALSGAERALAPLILLVFAAALLLRSEPVGNSRSVASRVAPRRGRRSGVTTTARKQVRRSTRGTRSPQQIATASGFEEVDVPGRSEERRVGKECRCRWANDG